MTFASHHFHVFTLLLIKLKLKLVLQTQNGYYTVKDAGQQNSKAKKQPQPDNQ
jgi:hypothetical protein